MNTSASATTAAAHFLWRNGLSIERVAEQHKEIEALNKNSPPFRILKGIESDILTDGSSTTRMISSTPSIWSSLLSTRSRRWTKIKPPHASSAPSNTWPPPSSAIRPGVFSLSRPGYPIDHRKVIDACAANDVIIELNANPYRLDIDWRWIPMHSTKASRSPSTPTPTAKKATTTCTSASAQQEKEDSRKR